MIRIIRRFSDLDNTLIFSRRRAIGSKAAVEYNNGRIQSYMPAETYTELQIMGSSALIPVSSRTLAQYHRIRFFSDGREPEFALIDNGGLLLVNGSEDAQWSRETFGMCREDIEIIKRLESGISSRVKAVMQDGLILFIKTDSHEIKREISAEASALGLIVFEHSEKLYICPRRLEKGEAVRRFKNRFGADFIVSAGDAPIDVSMASVSDKCLLSASLKDTVKPYGNITYLENEKLGKALLSYK